ncbi:glycosyltransferase, partial [bacterium]|nr:glycosyltransferase [bacterium]
MNKIKVSVIVPVYNRERYLKKCIQSIVDQTLKEIEIIIINDGSTDNSENIVKSFDDNRIKYIKQANSGQSVCRNRGIELATGEYIG